MLYDDTRDLLERPAEPTVRAGEPCPECGRPTQQTARDDDWGDGLILPAGAVFCPAGHFTVADGEDR